MPKDKEQKLYKQIRSEYIRKGYGARRADYIARATVYGRIFRRRGHGQ
ncbi:MAG: hypothetical protein IRZ03_16415 [Acidobacterium ailaaui]|nr:hypothetical protein [Pseudacidobacterium ailaaui]